MAQNTRTKRSPLISGQAKQVKPFPIMPNFEHSSKSIRMESYKVTLRNVDGLSTHPGRPDILLISETHFTNRSYCKIPSYKAYSASYPSDNVHVGSAR